MGFDDEVARQSGGPFNNRQERKLIRRVAEHWHAGQRYSEERRKRYAAYGWWIGVGTPIALAAIKIAEAFWKGP